MTLPLVLFCIKSVCKTQGHLAKKSFIRKFSNWIRGRRGRVSFLLKRRRDSKLFFFCNIEKRDINTFEKFPC